MISLPVVFDLWAIFGFIAGLIWHDPIIINMKIGGLYKKVFWVFILGPIWWIFIFLTWLLS